MPARVAINGFGRIGRQVLKAIYERYWEELEIVAIGVTDPFITDTRALLLQYDSTYGQFGAHVEAVVSGPTNAISVDGRHIAVVGRNAYGPVPEWGRLGVELVIEGTGYFKSRELVISHLHSGAERVIITAPAKNPDIMIVLGVNEHEFDPQQHRLISNASCTTNALAPAADVLHRALGIKQGLLTTVHAYTSSQQLIDHASKDPRRARSAALNIVPTSTGAARAVGQVIPALEGAFHGTALRVPVPTVSLADFTALVERPPDGPAEVNQLLQEAATNHLQGILDVMDTPLVSSDFVGDAHSSVVDAPATSVQGSLVTTLLWYDNEWGYSSRIADLAYYVTQRAIGVSHDGVRAVIRQRATGATGGALTTPLPGLTPAG